LIGNLRSPEVENWVIEFLISNRIRITTLEGYSFKGKSITGLFERAESNVEVSAITEEDVRNFLLQREEDWRNRCLLSKKIGVPLYLIFWKDNIDSFRIYRISIDGNNFVVDEIETLGGENLAKWLAEFKSINVTKGWMRGEERLAFIDKCLRNHNVPWPGNLDGFISCGKSICCIIEFSRTKKKPVKDHDIRKYATTEDKNRWPPFNALKETLGCKALIILWSSDEETVKIQEFNNFNSSGLHLIDENERYVKKGELLNYFKRICTDSKQGQ
jgi:hypothetical protein